MNSTPQTRGTFALGELIVAIFTLLLAAVVYWQVSAIPVSPLYAKVGPTVFPLITAAGLGIMGVMLLISALKGGWQPEEEKEHTPDRLALGWVIAGLVLNVLLIGKLGFTVASIILFVCVARGFGSRQPLRDAAIATIFALVAYLGFAKALSINIGAGLIENFIEQIFFSGRK